MIISSVTLLLARDVGRSFGRLPQYCRIILGKLFVLCCLVVGIAALNPLPRVPPKRVIVSNVGIRDKELPPVPGQRPFHRTFYTMTARGGGLPSWSTQIGSFNRARLTNMLHFLYPHQLARGGNWTARQLAESILAEAVLCRTLAQELRAHAELRALRPAVLLLSRSC